MKAVIGQRKGAVTSGPDGNSERLQNVLHFGFFEQFWVKHICSAETAEGDYPYKVKASLYQILEREPGAP